MKIINISETEYSIEGVRISDVLNKRYCVFDLEATVRKSQEKFWGCFFRERVS